MTSPAFTCKYCDSTVKHDRRVCRMRALAKDPEFRERHAEAVKAMLAERWQDPEFRERHAEATKAKWQDPEFNPLVLLTDAERADYDLLKKSGYSRADALATIGRTDLVMKAAAE